MTPPYVQASQDADYVTWSVPTEKQVDGSCTAQLITHVAVNIISMPALKYYSNTGHD